MKKGKPKQYPVLENIPILDFAAEGKCVAKVEEVVIFVEGVVAPGDLADLMVYKSKQNFKEATALNIRPQSGLRTQPVCKHFGVCGGCKWQHVDYQYQLAFKQRQVSDALQRIAKVKLPIIHPILGSEEPYWYRNKLEFSFSSNRWFTFDEMGRTEPLSRNALGFHVPKRFDKILDIERCHLQPDPSNAIRLATKSYAESHNFAFYDMKAQQGFIRNMVVRTANSGDVMVIVQFAQPLMEEIEGMMSFLANAFPEITSLHYVINQKGNDTFHDLEVVLYKGKPFIVETMEDLQFQIGPKSFYQTNAKQAYNLYKITRELADLQGNELVYDLYTGTGTIANFVAKRAKKVIGLEYVEMAVEDAKINSTINGITNTEFYAGDMRKLLDTDFINQHGRPEVVITDPPRAGMDEPVTQTLLKASPQKIVYVSCSPPTQARDIAILDEKYEVKVVQPVDMFPQTHHVENVVLLERR